MSNTIYNFKAIEKKWREYWVKHKTFRTRDPGKGDRTFYVLDMFPYPSGYGLHVGHPVGYLATDIVARYRRMRGDLVLHPMGWDAFGLPAEQHAIRTGEHPASSIARNIANYRHQMQLLGLGYDWDREINTSQPDYYRWTQFIFLALYDAWFDPVLKKARPIEELPIPAEISARGPLAVQAHQSHYRLVYFDDAPVNWCPALGTVLSNEEVYDGRSEQGYEVIRVTMRQVMMRITAFAERLLAGLETLDWPEGIKESQRNWIGRSTGLEIDFSIDGTGPCLTAYTTRPETLAGVSFMALAPELAIIDEIVAAEYRDEVRQYREETLRKSELTRKMAGEKTGVPLGRTVWNPLTGARIPLFVADYVLPDYGTGVVMGVPAHDERDWEFAQQYDLPVVPVIAPEPGDPTAQAVVAGEACWAGEGTMLHTPQAPHDAAYTAGMSSTEARASISVYLEKAGYGRQVVRYNMRDWVFARQRYWGDPIPLIHWESGRITALEPQALPLELPYVAAFEPTGDGQSALARAEAWVNVVDPATGERGHRETSTMPQWAGSCWYPLRFMDPHNEAQMVDPQKEQAWGPVDLYVGGAEHATLHLLYARFWFQAMYDLGLTSIKEPFRKLVNQGMLVSYAFENSRGVILPVDEVAEDAEGFIHQPTGERVERIVAKMSKSLRNVVTPDEVIDRFGSDAFRMFLMFLGPVEGGREWDTEQVSSTLRLLRRIWMFATGGKAEGLRDCMAVEDESEAVRRAILTLIVRVTEDMELLRLNTAVAEVMKFMNVVEQQPVSGETLLDFIKVLNPLAPHLAEELWERAGNTASIADEAWPQVDEGALVAMVETVQVVVQIGRRVRGHVQVAASASDEEIEDAASSLLHGRGDLEGVNKVVSRVIRDKKTELPVLVNFALDE